jgi:alginate O-acetyltransferase complex protein AlgI
MLFSSTLFVWLFLPLLLALYFSVRHELRNLLLLAASLLFYAWGEKYLVAIMLLSITANWLFGLWLAREMDRGKGKAVVVWSSIFNLGLLVLFKYIDWIFELVGLPLIGTFLPADSGLRELFLNPDGRVRLPIGISFFTFQAFSYVLDVYRRDAPVERSWFRVALYVSLFPQLIAGPIVRYLDVAAEIRQRAMTEDGFAYGIRRFVIGLGKKMLIANLVAEVADKIFGIPAVELTAPVAWLGILCYTLQIYFDFSAYSDMAIGLGHMFGFRFLENFNFPYISRSITEFWRRWHISLSTWFRDYLYIPMGGNRHGSARTYFNLVTVFFLCGLWHGASFVFVIWGLWHGAFLVIERLGLARWLEKSRPLAHVYTLLVAMIGWVFFRAVDSQQALQYLAAMAGLNDADPLLHQVAHFTDAEIWTAIIAGVIGSTPWLPALVNWWKGLAAQGRQGLSVTLEYLSIPLLLFVFFECALKLAAGSYNPFIYFRF